MNISSHAVFVGLFLFHSNFYTPQLRGGTDELWRNPEAPIDERVDDLISQMTPQEKISQLMMSSVAIPRLGVPEYHWWNEALHGVARNGVATVFPQAIALAATWDTTLMFEVADTISTEARAKNNALLENTGGASGKYEGLTIWSPNINIFRDPRWGRGQETYGEDPFLTGQLAVSFVRGLQGGNPEYLKTVATLKHFAVHSGPEPLRHHFDAIISERDLRDTYLPAFETGIREAGAMSVMSAYNAVNGIPAPANHNLLQSILREEWGFDGAIVGDVDNVSDMWRDGGHHFAKDAAEASSMAIRAGNDLCSGVTYQALGEAVGRGLIDESELDAPLRHLFKLRFQLGQFDPAEIVPYRSIPISENASTSHDQLAYKAAAESLVLLKNNGVLPLQLGKMKVIALLGPTAFEASTVLGNYSGTPQKMVPLADAIRTRFEAEGVQVFAEAAVPLVDGFRVDGKPFTTGVLWTDSTCTTGGLAGEVYSNTQLDGSPVSLRTDSQIDLQWDEAQPIEGLPNENTSIKWRGVITPLETGIHTLSVETEGSVRLWLDGKCIIESWKPRDERKLSTSVTFEAGYQYAIVLEYAHTRKKAHIHLGWKTPGDQDDWKRAMEAADKADVVLLALGLTPDLEGESMSVNAEGFLGGDRTSIELPASQRKLLDAVYELEKPVILLLTTGSALNWDTSKTDAELVCWYYGQAGAAAVVDTLLGKVNPAGRLPVTFYRDVSELPAFEDYSMHNRTYRYFSGNPMYAFGHGLSYTSFEYLAGSVNHNQLSPDGAIDVEVDLKNTGSFPGDEVIQIYAKTLNSGIEHPIRQLVAFKRVQVEANQRVSVSLPIPAQRLRRWDDRIHKYVVDPGIYELEIGSASDHLLLRKQIEVIPLSDTF